MAAMQWLDVFHPPAGISPVIIATSEASPLFIIVPVLAGVAILLLYAYIVHKLSGSKWPVND